MSVDAGISMNLLSPGGPHAIFDALLASHWSRHVEGWWSVPLGEETSEWRLLKSFQLDELKSLFLSKISAQEVIGIRLWWEGNAVGGEFLVFPNYEVMFSPSINRVKIGERTTDVSWYLARLLPVFDRKNGITLISWIWQETG